MKKWSLKIKFGIYSSLLATAAILVAALVAIPTIYYRHIAALDAQVAVGVQEFFRDMLNFQGAPLNPRHPLKERFVPLVLKDRFLRLEGPEGQELYISPSLKDADIKGLLGNHERKTATILTQRCRLSRHTHGDLTIFVGTPLQQIDDLRGDLLVGTLTALPAMALVVFLGGLWLGKAAVAPISTLTEVAERISASQPDERLPIPGTNDEISRLTEVLNSAFDRLQQAYEATARFSADASHQLKTPITVLRAGLENLRDQGNLGTDDKTEIALLLSQTRRLTTLVEDLLLLAQSDAGALTLETSALDIVPLVRAAADDLDALGYDRGLSVVLDCPDSFIVSADSRRVSIILQNLTENAARYASGNSQIFIGISSDENYAEISVENQGPAISETDKERIFQRFHRGSSGENVRGHGLGLNIASALSKIQGGDLRLVRSDENGTCFALRLPLISAGPAPG